MNATILQKESAGARERPDRAWQLRGYIESRLHDETLSIAVLAHRFGMSRASVGRAFRASGGVSRYIRERRIQLACQRLLEDPGVSLTCLLYELGFSGERQFQRAFHARFGMSPSAWRQRHRAMEARFAVVSRHMPADR